MRLGWHNENLEPKVLRFARKVLQDLPQVVANSPLSTICADSYDTNSQVGTKLIGWLRWAHDPILLRYQTVWSHRRKDRAL
jgi:hypothetical protein